MTDPLKDDTCPTCGASPVQTCVNDDGTPRADHPGRPTTLPDWLAITSRRDDA